MLEKTFDRIASYYDALESRYGHDPRACDYGRAESQQTKFRVICEMSDFQDKKILDVGCGFADFADYLESQNLNTDYKGIDLSEAMLRRAKSRRPDLDLRNSNFLNEDIGQFDIVTANGIFYLLGENAETITHRLIRRMFESARESVIFNSLSSWAPHKTEGEYYADPAKFVSFAQSLTPRVVLRHDYMDHDFTVALFHSDS